MMKKTKKNIENQDEIAADVLKMNLQEESPIQTEATKKKILKINRPIPKIDESFLKGLNSAQYTAALHNKGSGLIIAGAGSGKTRTLTHRVAHLLANNVEPSSIILVTFTKKAAEEMIQRVTNLVGDKGHQVRSGTFHSLANITLRRYAKTVGFQPNFTILDESDQKHLMKMVRARHIPEDMKTRYPSAEKLLEITDTRINWTLTLEDTIKDHFPDFVSLIDDIRKILDDFQNTKRKQNVMDFDDLMVFLLQFLQEENSSAFKSTIGHVLVDEYQDVNAIQAKIVDLLGEKAQSMVVVGDDAQSIYRFRGSDFTHMYEFPNRHENTITYKLEENYRSTPEILNLANSSIKYNKKQFEKTLNTTRQSGDRPMVISSRTMDSMASQICAMILQYREQGIPLEDQAVLFRGQYMVSILERELNRQNIPYEMRAGVKFFEQAHIKDLMAHLAILINPTDMVQWSRVFTLQKGLSDRAAEKIFAIISNNSNPLSEFMIINLRDKLKGQRIREEGFKSLEKLQQFLEPICWNSKNKSVKGADEYQDISAMVQSIAEFLTPIIRENYSESRPEDRLHDFKEVAELADDYADLPLFLGEVMTSFNLAGSSIQANPVDEDEAPLVLSTIHQAKGLEWKVVHVWNSSDGVLPNSRCVGCQEDIEEERRLFYVAATRAEDYLIFYYPELVFLNGMETIQQPSRFLEEIRHDNVFEDVELQYDN